MGFFIKLLLKAGVTLGVMYIGYSYMLNGGFGDMQLPGQATDVIKGVKGLGNAVMDKDVTVYKWVDAEGVTHFGGSAPTGQGGYQTKVISANTNVLHLQKKAAEQEEKTGLRSQITRVGKAYSPEGVKGTIDDAKNIQKLMDDRMLQQKKLLQDIKGRN